MANWYFKPLQRGGPISDPIQGEFFSTDAISGPGMALIREGIQNSLDQSIHKGPVLIRIFLSGEKNSAPHSEVKNYFKGALTHYNADKSGLNPNEMPSDKSSCNFMVFEDFSTTGLGGDPSQAFKPKEGGKNNFYHFFRAEGQTDKEGIELGSWGVGKLVFFRSSRINTVLGLTVRSNDKKRMLMGKTILKSHYVGDVFYQDGYYGIPPSEEQELVMPTTDSDTLDRFSDTFNLQRGIEDPGLSLVVPWPDPEINENVLISTVLLGYFYPILIGKLEVIVETSNIEVCLDKGTLSKEVEKLDRAIIEELKPLIELADWAKKVEKDQRFVAGYLDQNSAWKWSNSLINDEQLEKLKESYYKGNKIAIRVFVFIKKRDGDTEPTFFDIYMERDNNERSGRPRFIREGIIIPKVNAPRTRGVRAIVIAKHEPIAKFLRKAENPSHTEWQHYHLKEEYKRGYKTDLDFIKRSVHELVRIISETEDEEDTTLLSDFFSIPKELIEEDLDEIEKNDEENEDEDEGSKVTEPDNPNISSNSKKFRIQKDDEGFSILPTSNEGSPKALDIKVAYDTRRGHPLNKYNTADFELNKNPIQLEPAAQNITVLEIEKNRVIIEINDKEFEFHMSGFDKQRQLYVKATPKRDRADANTQN
jgi:hypothetical protein